MAIVGYPRRLAVLIFLERIGIIACTGQLCNSILKRNSEVLGSSAVSSEKQPVPRARLPLDPGNVYMDVRSVMGIQQSGG